MTDHADECCPACEHPLPRPMISERNADARARLSLLQDFEAIVLVPRVKSNVVRTIATKFLFTAPLSDLKKFIEAVLHLDRKDRRLKTGESDGP